MPSEKKSSKEKTKKLPKEALLLSKKSEKEQRHHFGVLLEDIQGKMSRVIETTELTRDELKRDMQSMEGRLTDRIETVEMVVRSHSAQLQSQSTQIQNLDKRVGDLDKKVENLDKKVVAVQADVSEIKQKLDRVVEKVEEHDKDIIILKAEVKSRGISRLSHCVTNFPFFFVFSFHCFPLSVLPRPAHPFSLVAPSLPTAAICDKKRPT